MGVSISRNPSCVIKVRMLAAMLLRNIIFLCRSGRRRSRYRYCKRKSSLVLEPVSMGNGGVCASERIRICPARTSISPVERDAFTAPALFSTVPTTAITNSLRSFSALAKCSPPQSLSSKTTCIRPERSRRSTKIIPPAFLCFCTHPIRVTSFPVSCIPSSAHL